jgi:tetratricopeptide (TPR) repeat protein
MRPDGRFWRHSRCLTIFGLFFIFCLPVVYSDTIILKSGKTVQGKIANRTEKSVEIDVGIGFPITYYRDNIESISSDNGGNDQPAAQSSSETVEEADRLERQGLELIDAGEMDKGVELMRKSIKLDPKPHRHLNLGTVLTGNGVSLFKSGKKGPAIKVLKQSEEELQKAIKLFDPEQESILLSQAYFLLGEIHAQAFEDVSAAREYYQKSISFYQNPAAERGLKALDEK